MQFAAEHRHLPAPWRSASTTSDWHLRLTAERAEELVLALVDVIEGWTEADEETPGAAAFVVNLNAFPRPGTVVLEGPSA
jgi:hypothetical protein